MCTLNYDTVVSDINYLHDILLPFARMPAFNPLPFTATDRRTHNRYSRDYEDPHTCRLLLAMMTRHPPDHALALNRDVHRLYTCTHLRLDMQHHTPTVHITLDHCPAATVTTLKAIRMPLTLPRPNIHAPGSTNSLFGLRAQLSSQHCIGSSLTTQLPATLVRIALPTFSQLAEPRCIASWATIHATVTASPTPPTEHLIRTLHFLTNANHQRTPKLITITRYTPQQRIPHTATTPTNTDPHMQTHGNTFHTITSPSPSRDQKKHSSYHATKTSPQSRYCPSKNCTPVDTPTHCAARMPAPLTPLHSHHFYLCTTQIFKHSIAPTPATIQHAFQTLTRCTSSDSGQPGPVTSTSANASRTDPRAIPTPHPKNHIVTSLHVATNHDPARLTRVYQPSVTRIIYSKPPGYARNEYHYRPPLRSTSRIPRTHRLRSPWTYHLSHPTRRPLISHEQAARCSILELYSRRRPSRRRTCARIHLAPRREPHHGAPRYALARPSVRCVVRVEMVCNRKFTTPPTSCTLHHPRPLEPIPRRHSAAFPSHIDSD
ncbi:hypothetical protein C7M84_020881 [Penaeus vannamei]|uniref:Uncharacterized protein n=1 Tax=Penaeus vannamei TaxID=6689 RepID=A0A3R7LQ09_PENVA|nr:hypothetical protein C7M84_020881 [Penaeus vannamei]